MSEHRARKRFGQNFLRDPGIIDRIIRSIRPENGKPIIEIGPGQGALTTPLVDSGAELTVVELDRDLIPILESMFGSRIRIFQGDALKTDFSQFHLDKPLTIVGNLPYNISTPLIFHLLSHHQLIGEMTFMLQKEVVDRLAAEPGSKAYGRLSVMTQYYCKVLPLFDVPPEAFTPRPKVTSAVVKLCPYHPLPVVAEDVQLLQSVVREAFNQRRKTLRNTLKKLCDEDLIVAAGIDPAARPETLGLKEYVALSNAIGKHTRHDDSAQ